MTTKEVEGGNLKCHRYWPDPTSSPPKKVLLFDDVKVQFVSAESHRDALVRTFNVIKGAESHAVTQICYLSWPDHGVPLTTGEFLRFRDFVSSVQRASQFPSSPIAIHCSAGVGRTGTYIAIDL
jgi:protein tyrosine phosphatase